MPNQSQTLFVEFLNLLDEGTGITAEVSPLGETILFPALLDLRESRGRLADQFGECTDDDLLDAGLAPIPFQLKLSFVRDSVAQLRAWFESIRERSDRLLNRIPDHVLEWFERVSGRLIDSIASVIPGGEFLKEYRDLLKTSRERLELPWPYFPDFEV